MFTKCMIAVSLTLTLATLPAAAQSVELGLPGPCRLVDLAPVDGFTLSMMSTFQIQAGATGLEGYYAIIWQEYGAASNMAHTVPGVAGTLFIDQSRTIHVFAVGGPMTGGALPGRSIPLNFAFPANPSLVGVTFIIQAIFTDAFGNHPTFTTALAGTVR